MQHKAIEEGNHYVKLCLIKWKREEKRTILLLNKFSIHSSYTLLDIIYTIGSMILSSFFLKSWILLFYYIALSCGKTTQIHTHTHRKISDSICVCIKKKESLFLSSFPECQNIYSKLYRFTFLFIESKTQIFLLLLQLLLQIRYHKTCISFIKTNWLKQFSRDRERLAKLQYIEVISNGISRVLPTPLWLPPIMWIERKRK